MEKFYGAMGVLFVIIVVLAVCLFLVKKKMTRMMTGMQTINANIASENEGTDNYGDTERAGTTRQL